MVALKDIDMPDECYECPFSTYDEDYKVWKCSIIGENLNKNIENRNRHDDCLLVEIKE